MPPVTESLVEDVSVSFEDLPGFDFQTLKATYGSGMKGILNGIQADGLAHLVWGSKPASLLHMDEFTLIDAIDTVHPLPEDRFVLLQATEKGEENMGWGGMLINIVNLRSLLEENPRAFKGCLLLQEKMSEDGKISVEDLIERLYDLQLQPAVLAQEKMIGVLLGYGVENAEKYDRSSNWGDASDEEKKILRSQSFARLYETEKKSPSFCLPPFLTLGQLTRRNGF